MAGIAAPLAYIKHYNCLYIASTYCEKQKGHYVCASDPLIDNNIAFGNTSIVHDGYNMHRQQKIHYLCHERKKLNLPYLNLRVCWQNNANGKNCINCEKCFRTIMDIIAEKENPNKYGLEYNKEIRKRIKKFLKGYLIYKPENNSDRHDLRWKPIQDSFKKNYWLLNTPINLLWFRYIKIASKEWNLKQRKEKKQNRIKTFKKNFKNFNNSIRLYIFKSRIFKNK